MTKIIYGTANFNSDYGILRSQHFSDIGLNKFLLNNHIDTLDTALAYKYDLKNLSLVRKKNLKIISKLRLPKFNKLKFLNNLEKNIRINLKYLKKKNYETMLFHNVNDLKTNEGKELLSILKDLKNKKLIKNIGTSIYDRNEINISLKYFKPEVIQFPLNPINKKNFDKSFVNYLKKIGIKSQIRSVFFQGLLLKNIFYIKKQRINKNIIKALLFIDNLSKKKKLTKLELTIDYVRSVNPDSIVVGVDNIQQFKIITELFKRNIEAKKINSLRKFDNIDTRANILFK